MLAAQLREVTPVALATAAPIAWRFHEGSMLTCRLANRRERCHLMGVMGLPLLAKFREGKTAIGPTHPGRHLQFPVERMPTRTPKDRRPRTAGVVLDPLHTLPRQRLPVTSRELLRCRGLVHRLGSSAASRIS
eukprot:scaffold952_cov249-Pinguiococcus_pyrenoidosus.AAC.5